MTKLTNLIRTNPREASNYFALASAYESAGRYQDAATTYEQVKALRLADPRVYLQIAGFYNRLGDFEKTVAALAERAALDPSNAEGYYTLATFYWDKAYRDSRLADEAKRVYIAKGLEHVDRALALRTDYADAMVYKNLLLRSQAQLETNESRRASLIEEADRLRAEALRLKKR